MIKKIALTEKEKYHLLELVSDIHHCEDRGFGCKECPFYSIDFHDYGGCLVDKLKEIADNN